MSNYQRTLEEVRTYIIARVPLIIIDTAERARAERLLRAIAGELSVDISYYTDARQVRSLTRSGARVDVDRDPLPYVAEEFQKKRRATFALGDCRRTGEDSSYTRELVNIAYLAQESSCTLILITADAIWPRLAQFGMMVRLDPPDMDERRALIASFVQDYRVRFPVDWMEADIDRAAALLSGFSETQIRNVLSAELVAHQALCRSHLKDLAGQKSRLFAAVSSIQPVRLPPELTVSGLDNLKAWLAEKQRVFFAPSTQLQQAGLTPPKGILLVGVSGCGKSLSAKMVAKTWELPLFRFDLGTVYDKYVGESEKKMQDALRFLDNVSPCVVWIDEIEKALAVSDGGNDVGRRVLGQFLFWLQESESRVFLVATANDITALPPELFRKGRFSELFFVDLPTADERAETLRQYCRRMLQWAPDAETLARLAAMTQGYSYADIAYAVQNLAERVLLEPDTPVDGDALAQRFRQIIPYAKTNAEILRDLRAWGTQRAVCASKRQEVCPQ